MRKWGPESVFLRFFVFGLVVVGWGFGFNIFLIELLHLYRPAAYALVIASQMLIGFLLNRYCVFDGSGAPFISQFLKYLSALALFRGVDWGLYSVQVELFSIPYLLAQTANTVFIFLSKFFLYKRIFQESSSDARPALQGEERIPKAEQAGSIRIVQATEDPNLRYHKAQACMALLPNYYRWIGAHFRSDISGVVLELGCGTGHMIAHYLDLAERIVAVDVNPLCVQTVKTVYGSFGVRAIQSDLLGDWKELAGIQADVVVALDLLEHMRDEHTFLVRLRSCLKPGGRVVLKVPAQRRLFSEMDRASGHYRRYDKTDLVRLMTSEGFYTRWVRGINPVGALVYRLKRHRSTNFSRTFSPGQLRMINLGLTVLPLLDRMPYEQGLSLVGVFATPVSGVEMS